MSDISTRAKSETINLRATENQKALLRRAAAVTDHSLSEFILGSAVDQAEQVLADRRWFAVDNDQFEEFVRQLDAPLPSTAKFDRLFSRKSRFAADDS